jgi:cob(I)alamin adenosyltransferase
VVTLNRIYTRTGDGGTTRLVTGETVSKASLRVEAFGGVDELNAALGLVRLHTQGETTLDPILGRIQNDLFDLGADLATPRGPAEAPKALRIVQSQVDRLEAEIDDLNASLSALTSFVLPGGAAASAYLHMSRTVCRRAERAAVAFGDADASGAHDSALRYLNRLSDLLFVAARFANDKGEGDVLWKPGATR